MPSAAGPDLKKYMDKRLQIKLNGNRTVTGVLRGFDQFMNLVLDETMEIVRGAPERVACRHFIFAVPPYSRACAFSCVLFYFPQVSASEQNKVGMVVIRGNSVVMIEALEKLWGD